MSTQPEPSPAASHPVIPAISARLGAVVRRGQRAVDGTHGGRFLKVLIGCQLLGLAVWALTPQLSSVDGTPVDGDQATMMLIGATTAPSPVTAVTGGNGEQAPTPTETAPESGPASAPATTTAEQPAVTSAPTAPVDTPPHHARIWAPNPHQQERTPSDHPPVSRDDVIKVRVVTVRARVTAYTPYDHRITKPEWADGIVAWHPGGRKRHVDQHRYGLATDWQQFAPGATFIRVPGYMERTFDGFPENFRVVDDACGRSRIARRRGEQPVIDVRFMTRYSAIDPRGGWGSRHLNVEVIFPADQPIPTSLRRWVVSEAWHTYHRGVRID